MQERSKIQHVLVKMYRSSDRLMVAVPLPGLEPEDVLVTVDEHGCLLIQGAERGLLKDVKELLLDEWSVGSYRRELTLPNTVDGSRANVTYRNGVLVIALPIVQRNIAARITLDRVGTAYGERAGNAGRTVQFSKQ